MINLINKIFRLEDNIKNFGTEYIKKTFINKIGSDFSKNYDLKNTRRLIRYLEIIDEVGCGKFLQTSKALTTPSS